MKSNEEMPSYVIITIILCFGGLFYLVFNVDEMIAECQEWQIDIKGCDDEECCKNVRARRPHACHFPHNENLCSVKN